MLSRLFASVRRTGPIRKASVPPGTLVYAVGDIHGRLDLLRAAHERILADARAATVARKVVVYLGDYIDRGSDSRQVIDLLIDEPLPGFHAVHLKGNHEQALLDFLMDIDVAAEWFAFGGDATLSSYQVARPVPGGGPDALRKVQSDLRARLPERHFAFYRSLSLSHHEGDYVFVHAGIRPGLPLDAQDEHDLMWIRDEFLKSTVDHGCVVVHGHSITPRPDVKGNRIGIDTGAYATGRLTCLRLELDEREFLTS